MSCPQCGTETHSSEQFCNRCGYTLQTNPDLLSEADREADRGEADRGGPISDQNVAGQQAAELQRDNSQQQAFGQQKIYEQYPQQPYLGPSYPPYPSYPSRQPDNGTGVGSLVCGIVGMALNLFCLPVVGLVLGIIAINMGRKTKKSGNVNRMGSAGFVLGIISVVFNALVILFWVVYIAIILLALSA